MTISVIIITKNEEHTISDCLASVSWADQIVVVDSGSTDKTVEICESFGACIEITKDWPGFGPQKNRALNLANCDWILSIDADEIISKELQQEIQKAVKVTEKNQAFCIPRMSSFCGKFIKHSGWWPDYVLRLFPNDKEQARFTDDIVHEKVIFNGAIKTLTNPIIHISYRDLEEVLIKMNRYSTDGAIMASTKGKKSSLTKAINHSLWAFVRTYIFKLGFLDGKMGFILATSNAHTTYYRYLKLMLLNKQ